MNCKHCEAPNTEGWFYCRDCGKRASSPKFTSTMFMRSEAGKRTDMEFSTISMDDHINKMAKDKKARQNKIWQDRVKQASIG